MQLSTIKMFPLKYCDFYSITKNKEGKALLNSYFKPPFNPKPENFTSTNMFTVYELSTLVPPITPKLKSTNMTDSQLLDLKLIREHYFYHPRPYTSPLPIKRFSSSTPFNFSNSHFSPYNGIDYIMATYIPYRISKQRFTKLASKYGFNVPFSEETAKKIEQIHQVYLQFKRIRQPVKRKQAYLSYTEGLQIRDSLAVEWLEQYLLADMINPNASTTVQTSQNVGEKTLEAPPQTDIQQQIISLEFDENQILPLFHSPESEFAIYCIQKLQKSLNFHILDTLKKCYKGVQIQFKIAIKAKIGMETSQAVQFAEASTGIKLIVSWFLGGIGKEDFLDKVNSLDAREQFWVVFAGCAQIE